MPDPSLFRYGVVPGFVVLWLLAAISLGLFAWRVYHLLRILHQARPEGRLDRLGSRIRMFTVQVLGQRRLLNEPAIGAAHFFIFWAFIFYATGFWWSLVKGLAPFLPIPYADDVRWLGLALELFGVFALAGIVVAAVRRYVLKPDRLEQSPDAARILGLIALLLASYLLGAGFKAAAAPEQTAWSPVGNAIAGVLTRLGNIRSGARTGYLAMWWLHMVTVLTFLAYLPYSKHLHLLAAPFGVLFGSLDRGGLRADAGGAAGLGEFTWRELLSGLSCAECGRCDRACPAVASGATLSPKELMHHAKEMVTGAIPPLWAPERWSAFGLFAGTMTPELGPTLADGGSPMAAAQAVHKDGTSDGPGAVAQVQAASVGSPAAAATAPRGPAFLGEVVTRDEIWGCTTCLSCMERCPVFNEHVPFIVEMRRHLVSEGDVDPHVQEALVNLTRYGNSFGQSPRGRTKWTQGLGFTVKDVRKDKAEYLWFVGDYASFDARLQAVTKTTARLLRYAGVDFGVLGDGEQNSGNDARRVGEEGLFEMLRDKNLKALAKGSFEKIVTTDPHTYHALTHDYRQAGDGLGKVPVLHISELLADLVAKGNLPVARAVVSPVTYHDPCYLGRYNGIYEAPRRLLRALGLLLVEMPRNRAQAFCCGAGGGRIWMEDGPTVKERPSESRVKEAAALPGVHLLAVACPKDLVMFQDALKTTGLDTKIRAVDIAELAAQATLPNGPMIEWQ